MVGPAMIHLIYGRSLSKAVLAALICNVVWSPSRIRQLEGHLHLVLVPASPMTDGVLSSSARYTYLISPSLPSPTSSIFHSFDNPTGQVSALDLHKQRYATAATSRVGI